MPPETLAIVLAIIALIGGPASALIGAWLNRRASAAQVRSSLTATQMAVETAVWDKAREALNSCANQISALKVTVDEEAEKTAALETSIGDLVAEREALKAELGDRLEENEALQARVAALEEELKRERQARRETEEENGELKDRVRQLELRLPGGP